MWIFSIQLPPPMTNAVGWGGGGGGKAWNCQSHYFFSVLVGTEKRRHEQMVNRYEVDNCCIQGPVKT